MPRLLASHAIPAAAPKGIKVVTMFSSPYAPQVEAFGLKMLSALPGYLAEGEIVPNRVRVIDGGLNGLPEAFELANQSLGVKFVIHPQETV